MGSEMCIRDSSLKGQVPVGLLVLKLGVERKNSEIIDECIQLVRKKIGPVASFKKAAIVSSLPKTRSGKILRGTMQKIADNEDYKIPATIEDASVLRKIDLAFQGVGLSNSRG